MIASKIHGFPVAGSAGPVVAARTLGLGLPPPLVVGPGFELLGGFEGGFTGPQFSLHGGGGGGGVTQPQSTVTLFEFATFWISRAKFTSPLVILTLPWLSLALLLPVMTFQILRFKISATLLTVTILF